MSLKFSRYREWGRVIRVEFPDWRQLLLALPPMLWHGLHSLFNPTPKKIWMRRIRICHRCPIYNPGLRQCRRKYYTTPMGCGCYTPFLATIRRPYAKGCWYREFGETEPKDENIIAKGWPSI